MPTINPSRRVFFAASLLSVSALVLPGAPQGE